MVDDGHLIFASAINKNITFRVSGGGKINFPSTGSPSQDSGDPGGHVVIGGGGAIGNVRALEERIQRLEDTVNADPGLPQRLRAIEERISQLQSRHDNQDSSSLQSDVDTLKTDVRQIKRLMRRMWRRLNTDDCASNPCSNGGTCVNTYSGYFCQCPDNWEGSRCDEDVNECSRFAGTDLGCQNGATCQNTPGAYRFQDL